MRQVRTASVVAMLALSVLAPVFGQGVSGTWEFRVELDAGSGEPTFVLEQAGDQLVGTYQGTFGAADVVGRVDGDRVEFWFETQGTKATYTGTILDAKMKGTCEYGGVGSGTWEAERVEDE